MLDRFLLSIHRFSMLLYHNYVKAYVVVVFSHVMPWDRQSLLLPMVSSLYHCKVNVGRVSNSIVTFFFF